MAGIFGVTSTRDCIRDIFLGTFYLQSRAQDYCGLFWNSEGSVNGNTHKGLLENCFEFEKLKNEKAEFGIGSVSVTREPVSGLSKYQSGNITFDGNLKNGVEIRDAILKKGGSFSGFHFPNQITDCDLIANIVFARESFDKGIESLFEIIEGDFSVINLNKEGIYAARGFGRKPLVLGTKEDDKGKSYAVSSESTSFVNLGFEILRDVNPGEVVFLNKEGVHSIRQFDLGDKIKYGTFEWIYTAYPTSIIDKRPVSEVRKRLGGLLAEEYSVDADLVSPVPNSGRWHALGYAQKSQIPYEEVFVRFDYSGRSFTPGDKKKQQRIADTKIIPVSSSVKDKKIVLVDDSIVRGTQTKNQTYRLRDQGAKEVHLRVACPPLMCACCYGKSTKKDEDCVARVMEVDEIRRTRGLDSLSYANVEMLERAIGYPRDKLCLDCWDI